MKMQKIAIIGGTGMTGLCVVEHALKKGLQVRLNYRDESTVPDELKSKVELVRGDAKNVEDMKNLIKGVDGVCVILGTRNNLAPTTELSIGTQNIVDAMKEVGVKRFSIVMSSFLFWDQSKVPPPMVNINEEHKRMLEITKQSGLDYTAVLPPHIANEPSGDVSILHDESPGRAVSKWDLGAFIVDCLDQPEHLGKICGIAKKVQ